MSQEPRPASRVLEQLTAAVLLAVVIALGWMIVVAYQPAWFRLPSVEME